jgi:hypothetical protein
VSGVSLARARVQESAPAATMAAAAACLAAPAARCAAAPPPRRCAAPPRRAHAPPARAPRISRRPRTRLAAPRAALSPEAARAAVDAAVRGDADALAAATGQAVNAAAAVGVPDVAIFLLAVFAPPVALAARFGTGASGPILATSALMVLPTLALITRPAPRASPASAGAPARNDIAPLPTLCLLAADALALLRIFAFPGGFF